MKILEAASTQYRRGILRANLDEVKEALTHYADGRSGKSQATHQQLEREGAGMAIALHSLIAPRPDSFLARMFQELDQKIAERGRAHLSYDYEAMGTPFLKSTIEVRQLESGQFILEMSAAYVGDEIEERLAIEVLEVERMLHKTGATLTIGYEGSEFALDFNLVAEKLGGTPLEGLTGEQIATIIAAGRPYDSWSERLFYPGIVTLPGDELHVTISVDDVNYAGYTAGLPFQADGGVLRGPLENEWQDKTKFMNPKIIFTITTTKQEAEESYKRLPVLDTALEQKMLELASTIANRFS